MDPNAKREWRDLAVDLGCLALLAAIIVTLASVFGCDKQSTQQIVVQAPNVNSRLWTIPGVSRGTRIHISIPGKVQIDVVPTRKPVEPKVILPAPSVPSRFPPRVIPIVPPVVVPLPHHHSPRF